MTSILRNRQEERTDLSDSRMLEAAIKLIVERGTDKTTLKEVGELAGYSRGLAGYRFGNKTGLFKFVVLSVGEEWLQSLKKVTENKAGFESISAAVDAHYQFCEQAPDHLAAFYTLWFESIGPHSELKKVISDIHERRHQDVAAWINEGIDFGQISPDIDANAVAEQFSASIVGIVYQWLINPSDLNTIKRLYENLKQSMRLWLKVDEADAHFIQPVGVNRKPFGD